MTWLSDPGAEKGDETVSAEKMATFKRKKNALYSTFKIFSIIFSLTLQEQCG